jgi:hypothetical protein
MCPSKVNNNSNIEAVTIVGTAKDNIYNLLIIKLFSSQLESARYQSDTYISWIE